MFGIGLPELIVILGLALIVVGPDKLPELARSIAKGILELKKTAEGLKDELTQEGGVLEDLRPEIDAVKTLKQELIQSTRIDWQNDDLIDTLYSVKDGPEVAKNKTDPEEPAATPAHTDKETACPAEDSTPDAADPAQTINKDEKQPDDAGKKP